MSKYLNVSSGDYKITVKNGGDIVLDIGESGTPGSVRVTGDLIVEGETTTITSSELAFRDNIIVLNQPEEGNENGFTGVQPDGGTAGLLVDRGTLTDALWVFDENVKWEDPQNPGTSSNGGWSPRLANGDVIGIEAVSITTPNGSDLNLLGVYDGPGGTATANPGKLTVRGTVDYEDRITEDDDIPNKKYIDDAILRELEDALQSRIEEGTFAGTETYVETLDDTVTSQASRVLIGVDGNVVADFRSDSATIQEVQIVDNTIQSTLVNQDLVLTANGVGSVAIDDDLLLTKTPHNDTGVTDPIAPVDGIKIYGKAEGTAGTGIYFVNENNTRDELVSRNRALVYSMIF